MRKATSENLILSVDAMGGDDAPEAVVAGIDLFARKSGYGIEKILLHGHQDEVAPLLAHYSRADALCELRHTDTHITMTDKPSDAIRRSRGSSMWNAVLAVKEGEAQAAISAGNTGALMVLGKVLLGMSKNVHRPAIAASWPHPDGYSVVLDVGANVVCTADQLVQFAILGDAFARMVHGKENPSVGLLNVGTEDLKGNDVVREADRLIRATNLPLNYQGFVEGDDISLGTSDVVVTDGFTGNVALKSAEGTAKLAAKVMKRSFMSNWLYKISALMSRGAFQMIRDFMDPRNVNGGLFMGLGGLVVKSHGGTDAVGFANALSVAARLAASDYMDVIEENLSAFAQSQPEEIEA